VKIFDKMGRLVYLHTLTNPETAITLQVAEGIYNVKVVSQEGKMAMKRVLIMK